MVEEGGLDEKLGESSSLDVVVVGLGDSSHPRVRGAVGGDVEVEGLKGERWKRGGERGKRSAKRVEGDASSSRVRELRETTNLEHDSLSLEDLILGVSVLSHVDELVDAVRVKQGSRKSKVSRASSLSSSNSSETRRRRPSTKEMKTHEGARISSYLAAMNMAVTPTS